MTSLAGTTDSSSSSSTSPKGQGMLLNSASNMCLDIFANKTDKGTRQEATALEKGANVQAYRCHKEGNQMWYFKDGSIVNPATGLCLDVFAYEMPNGKRAEARNLGDASNIQVWTCNNR